MQFCCYSNSFFHLCSGGVVSAKMGLSTFVGDLLISFENKITHFATLAITIFFISISIAFGKRISIFQQIHTSRPHFQHILQHLSKRFFGCIRQLQTHLRIRTNTQIQQGHSTHNTARDQAPWASAFFSRQKEE